MSITYGEFSNIANVTAPEGVEQTNWEVATRVIYSRTPTYQSGAPNAITGPPTTGTWNLGQIWRDQNLALWICTVAGGPGVAVWKQIEPAPVNGTGSFIGTPTSHYVIADMTAYLKLYQWGGAAWVAV